MIRNKFAFVMFVLIVSKLIGADFCAGKAGGQTRRWTEQKANAWYAQQPWLVGSNYVPGSAINQLEMWQEATFDPAEIDKEFSWAEGMGMNTMRIFLHDLLWEQDAVGFQKRMDQFLAIASRHHIRPMFVLFDSCWDPLPHLGPQHPPIPGVHNSGWVQSPGAAALGDAGQYPRLKATGGEEGSAAAYVQQNVHIADGFSGNRIDDSSGCRWDDSHYKQKNKSTNASKDGNKNNDLTLRNDHSLGHSPRGGSPKKLFG
jgi:hypothetical protein